MILLTGDSSVEETEVAVAAGGEILQHSVARREARKKKKNAKKGKKGTRARKERKGKGTRKGNKKMKNNKKMQRRGKKGSKKKGTRTKKKNAKPPKRKQSKSRNAKKLQKLNRNQRQGINYTECAMQMKEFASRIKKAGNLERQAKRITDFKKINDNKKGKVRLGRHFHSCGISVLVERKF